MTQTLSSEASGASRLGRLAAGLQPTEAASRIVTWGLVVLSLALALWHYFGDRSLWLDEAMLALNVVELPWSELLHKLVYEQIAAVGWLFAQKALYLLIGDLEQGLRLFSLAAWAATLVVFRNLAARTFSPIGAILCVAVFAFAVPFVQYAVEAKPYELDLFIGAAGLALFVDIHRGDRIRPSTWIGYALLGLFTVTFTLGGALALAAFGGLSILSLLLRRRFAPALLMGAISLVCAGVFAGLYVYLYRGQVAGGDLVSGASAQYFTRTSYAPASLSLSSLAWYANWADQYFYFVFKTSRILGFLLVLVGLGVLACRDKLLALPWIATVALGLAVSAAHLYPMFERLTFFSMAALFWTVGAGLDWLSKPDGRRLVAVACLTLATMSASLIDIAGYSRTSPPYARQDIRPAMRLLKQEAAPGDKIYVANLAVPGYLIYREPLLMQGLAWRAGRIRDTTWPCVLQDVPDLRAGDTLWVLVTYDDPPEFAEDELHVASASHGLAGHMTVSYQANGASLYRATFRGSGAPSQPPPLDCGLSIKQNYFDVPPKLARYLGAP